MTNYDFSTLNDKEFEEIVKDLLNSEHQYGLKSFAAGRDKGIDLRKWTKGNPNEIVVQVKHYVSSPFKTLKSDLERKEKPKVIELKPNRYIFVTSQNLTAVNRADIMEIFSPFILSDDDIYSRKDLNDLLSKHSKIEKKYYKLWLSSTTVLQSLLNNAVEQRTRYFMEKLSTKIKYLVPTTNLNIANKILKKQKILLITGQPGIGKSTLAEIILFNSANKGFKIHKVEDIIEAERLMSADQKEKIIFYFDDFLGANYAEILDSHRTETRLTGFVERIYDSKNKYLILTTRTVVLQSANNKYEKINRSRINTEKFELKLKDYSKYDKALILYNHLYFNKIGKKLFEVILKDKFYFKIIEHKSYAPRIIEFLTDETKIAKFTPEQYKQFIITNLDNPSEIWSYSFRNQIDYFDRCLLITLFTFSRGVTEEGLIKAYESRLEYEKSECNQIIVSSQFNDSLKRLLDGFITKSIQKSDGEKDIVNYKFINPSLTDYLLNYIKDDVFEKKSLVCSVVYFSQLSHFDPNYKIVALEVNL